MGSTWDHPELGRFHFDGSAWVNVIAVPAFKAFTYDTGYSNAGRLTGRHDLAFEADYESNTPTATMVELASEVLARQAELVSKVTAALWDDFNGRGPRSGMWWHGGLDEVSDGMEDTDLPPLAGPDDLLAWMRLSQIRVRRSVHGYDEPVVELGFDAAFEEEHGVGILTDGQTILGTGYCADVTPFKSE